MRRPFASDEPIGPLRRLTGGSECVLRFGITYDFREPPTEAKQSLKRGIKSEVGTVHDGLGEPVHVDNIAMAEGDRGRMEIRMDLPVKESDDDLEEEVVSSVSAALINGGADGPKPVNTTYSAVSR